MNGDNNGDKAPWEVKKGLRAVESSNGVHMFSPYSTATGLYGQRFTEIKDLPIMEGISREQFGADTTLQNQILDMRWRGDIPNVPAMTSNAMRYQKEYPNQIGNLTFNELAMLSNLTGRQRGREYFASKRPGYTGPPFKMPQPNKTPEEYIARIREALKQKKQDAKNLQNKVPYAAAANNPKAYNKQITFLDNLLSGKSSFIDKIMNKDIKRK
tara:strand:+ start:29 stop:667 length:639 start_codon:yes stop_codon:yes gene_type:complete